MVLTRRKVGAGSLTRMLSGKGRCSEESDQWVSTSFSWASGCGEFSKCGDIKGDGNLISPSGSYAFFFLPSQMDILPRSALYSLVYSSFLAESIDRSLLITVKAFAWMAVDNVISLIIRWREHGCASYNSRETADHVFLQRQVAKKSRINNRIM